MRLMRAICAALVLSSLTYSQGISDAERVIRRIVDSGLLDGHDQKLIGPLGDAGAVLVIKTLAGRNLTSNTIDNALTVIDGSFADPTHVEALADKQPRAVLLLLRYLELSTNDSALKKRIA